MLIPTWPEASGQSDYTYKVPITLLTWSSKISFEGRQGSVKDVYSKPEATTETTTKYYS